MDIKSYFHSLGRLDDYEALSDEDKLKLNIFDILTADKEAVLSLEKALNFFIKEDVCYSSSHLGFLVKDGEDIVGFIDRETYYVVCDLICQRCYIKTTKEDLGKIKNKKALGIMKKILKGREEKAKASKSDKNMELGNIISSVANKSLSLNISNIWDITIYQLWDCFARISNNNIYEIQSTSVAAYGNKDNHFDANAWFKRLDTNN